MPKNIIRDQGSDAKVMEGLRLKFYELQQQVGRLWRTFPYCDDYARASIEPWWLDFSTRGDRKRGIRLVTLKGKATLEMDYDWLGLKIEE